jgi:hypothetical protein
MKISKKWLAGLAGVGLGLISVSAWADTLQMKDGRVVQGKFLGGTQASVQFEVNGKIELFDVGQIISLTFTGPAIESRVQPYASSQPAPVASASGVTVPAGTHLLVRMIDSVDSNKNHPGDIFRASLESDLDINGVVVARKGADVFGRLAEAIEAGHFEGKSDLKLELTDLVINNQRQPIMTGDYEVSGSSRGSNTAKKVGGGAVAGAIIGAIAGGGKGAAIGAGVGGGAGAAVQVLTKGQQVHVPSETLLDFRVEQPFTAQTASR